MIGKEISIDKPYWLILEKGKQRKREDSELSLFSPHLVFVPNTTQTAVLQLRHRRDPLPVSCALPCHRDGGIPTVH